MMPQGRWDMRLDETVYFFDAHGLPWETCERDWHGAVAFGPAGCARELDLSTCPCQGAFDNTNLVTHDEATGFDVVEGTVRMSNGLVHWDQAARRYVIGGEGSFVAGFVRHAGSERYEAVLVVSDWVYDPSVEAAGLAAVLIGAKRRVLKGE